VAVAKVAQRRQAALQAAGGILEAALLAVEVAEGVQGVGLCGAVAGGLGERQAVCQGVGVV
jgi:hypothetical protein